VSQFENAGQVGRFQAGFQAGFAGPKKTKKRLNGIDAGLESMLNRRLEGW